jgi:amino acid adenylation domain-containing protein
VFLSRAPVGEGQLTDAVPHAHARASVAALFEAQAAARGAAVAILCDGESLSYRALDAAATGIAVQLIRAGISKGAIVGVLSQRSVAATAAILGILKAGAAYLPLDPSYPAALLGFIAADSGAALTLVQASLPWSGKSIALRPDCTLDVTGTTPTPAEMSEVEARTQATCADDLAYVMYTSGSTGRPKGVRVPHRGILRLVAGCDFAELGPREVMLHLAPLSFDASTFEVWGALLNGGALAIVPASPASLDDIAAAIGRHHVTTAWLTAGLFNMMVERRLEGLTPLRQLITGGDVLSPAHIARAMEAMPACRFVNGYGPTENTTFTCCYAIPRDHDATCAIPIGTAIRGTSVHVLDETLRPVSPGGEGELCTGGDGVALGYLNRPELTAEKFIADPFSAKAGALLYRTGDRVRQMDDGTLAFLGRVDRQIKLNGKRVELDAIEACLRAMRSVGDAAVLSRLEPGGQATIVAFVAPAANATLDASAIRTALREVLPDFMIPADIQLLDMLPLTRNGKIDRGELAQRQPRDLASAPFDGPTQANATQTRLQAIWRHALRRIDLGLDDNFFDLGGTSLQLLEVHAQITPAFAVSLPLTELFAYPTIRRLAARIDGTGDTQHALLSVDDRAAKRSAALARARAGNGRRGAA